MSLENCLFLGAYGKLVSDRLKYNSLARRNHLATLALTRERANQNEQF